MGAVEAVGDHPPCLVCEPHARGHDRILRPPAIVLKAPVAKCVSCHFKILMADPQAAEREDGVEFGVFDIPRFGLDFLRRGEDRHGIAACGDSCFDIVTHARIEGFGFRQHGNSIARIAGGQRGQRFEKTPPL